MIDTCDWNNPGADPYVGTARAAIMSFAQIPKAARIALVARAEAKTPEYDDVVMVDRDAIRGRREYEPGIGSMHFGGAGRVCAVVTRTGWSDQHVESAMVFCADGWCVARFSVCNNWSIIRLADRPAASLPPITGPGGGFEFETLAAVPVPGLPPAATLTPPATFAPPAGAPPSYGPPLWYLPPPIFVGGPCCVPCFDSPGVPGIPTPVPEPSTWLLFACGLALLSTRLRRRAT